MKKPDKAGRLDLLALGTAKVFTERAEREYGLEGLWEVLAPHATRIINSMIGPNALGKDAKELVKFVGKNYVKTNPSFARRNGTHDPTIPNKQGSTNRKG